jgi:hypothetical protein
MPGVRLLDDTGQEAPVLAESVHMPVLSHSS